MSALHQRIVRNKSVRPHGLHQFLFADQSPRIFDQYFSASYTLGRSLTSTPGLSRQPLSMSNTNSPNS